MKKIILFIVLFFSFINISFAYNFLPVNTTYIWYWLSNVNSQGIAFNDEWTIAFVIDNSTNSLYQWNFTIPYDFTTATQVDSHVLPYSIINWMRMWPEGLFFYWIKGGAIYKYWLWTAWDLTTLNNTLLWQFSSWYSNCRSINYNDNWTKFYVTWINSNDIKTFNLSTAWDLNTAVLFASNSLWFTQAWLFLSENWIDVLLSWPYWGNSIQYVTLDVAFDFSSITAIHNNTSFITWYGKSIFANNDFSEIFITKNVSWIYHYKIDNSIDILKDLAFTSTGEILPIQDGFTLSGTIINVDHKLIDIEIYQYEAWTTYLTGYDRRILNETWSWWIELELEILSDESLTFLTFQDYEINITFETLDWLQTINNFYIYGDYNYNAWYTEPIENDFSFVISWIDFFENWFGLLNFVPNPTWWELYFEIIAPALNWTWTIDITTESFLPYNVDWNGYWFNSVVTVTYPYHQIAGYYQVRVVYKYDDLIIYPFWTDYNGYEITLAESPYEPEKVEELYLCDTDLNWIIEIWEALACPFKIIKYYSTKVYEIVERLKNFFEIIMNIWTDEVKTFSFIPSANANVFEWLPNIESQDNFLSKMYFFIKWFLYFIFLLFTILLIIFLKRH